MTRRLGDERGQVLVLFVGGLTVFVLLLALVVDVGLWFQAQRNVQSSADDAALAAVQANLRTNDWSSCQGTTTCQRSRSQQVTGPFSGIAGIGTVDAKATASASAEPAASIDTSDLVSPTYLLPLVVKQSCVGRQNTLLFDDSDHDGSCLGVICPSSCSSSTFDRWVANGWAGTLGLGRVGAAPLSATDCQRRRRRRPPDCSAIDAALQSAQDTSSASRPLIVPVFDDANSNTYDISGFAAVDVTDFGWQSDSFQCRPRCKWIRAQFEPYQYTTSKSLPLNPPTADYGVRAIGLTS